MRFRSGDTIFSAGDEGDRYFFILDGEVSIQQPEKPLIILDTGQGFGELALLTTSPRQATAKAVNNCLLLAVDGAAFRGLYVENEELRSYIQTLKGAYALMGYGIVTQHTGVREGLETLTTITHLDSGRAVSVMRVIGRDEVAVQVLGEGTGPVETYEYKDALVGIERSVSVDSDGRLVAIRSLSPWMEIGRAYHELSTEVVFSVNALKAFEETGLLYEKVGVSFSSSDVICHCMQKTYQELFDAIQRGVDSVEKIEAQLLCGTICGGCKPQLAEITGAEGWHPAVITDEFELVNGIRSFRFQLFDALPVCSKAGQHAVVRAPVKGHWINRPYTLTNAANEHDFLEITVKREIGGIFSSWVFDDYQPGQIIYLSKPQGDSVLDTTRIEGAVFFAAGIGVTPAISMLRTIEQQKSETPFYLDYSCHGAEKFAFRDEIEAVANASARIEVKFRDTETAPRLTADNVQGIVQKHSSAKYFICGPAAYQAQLEKFLKIAGVPDSNVHVEEFVPVAKTLASSEEGSSDARWKTVARFLGLATFSLLLIQYYVGSDLGILQGFQNNFTYQVGSGLVLLILVLFQWRLGFLRNVGALQKASVNYHRHILIGSAFPIAILMHSSSLGNGVAMSLVLIFMLLIGSAFFDHQKAKLGRYKALYISVWVPIHIVLSMLATSLLLVHVFVVFSFK